MAIDQQAVNYLKNKEIKTSFSYKDIWQNEHSHSFTVAKIMQADVLQDIKDAMVDALENGKTLKQFQKELIPTLQAKGWWGEQKVIDPKTGKTKLVNVNPREVVDPKTGKTKQVYINSRRLQVIYDSNKRAARAASTWQRAQETKKYIPYFIYELGPSEHHRAQHLLWAGLIRPIDDTIWQSIFPPNGWGCKCRVRQITTAEAIRLGGVSDPLQLATENYINTRTGKTSQVPKGVDPAWGGNTGINRTQMLNEALEEKILEVDEPIAKTVIKDCITSSYFKDQIDLAKEIQNNTFKGNTEEVKQQFLPVALTNNKLNKVLNLKQKQVIRFSGFNALNTVKSKNNLTEDDYLFLQDGLNNFTGYTINKYDITLIYTINGKTYKATIQKTKQNELYLTELLKDNVKSKSN